MEFLISMSVGHLLELIQTNQKQSTYQFTQATPTMLSTDATRLYCINVCICTVHHLERYGNVQLVEKERGSVLRTIISVQTELCEGNVWGKGVVGCCFTSFGVQTGQNSWQENHFRPLLTFGEGWEELRLRVKCLCLTLHLGHSFKSFQNVYRNLVMGWAFRTQLEWTNVAVDQYCESFHSRIIWLWYIVG